MNFAAEWILTAVIFLPLVGAVTLLFANARAERWIRTAALLWSAATLLLVLWALSMYGGESPGSSGFVLTNGPGGAGYSWLGGAADGASTLDIRFHLGVDGISIWLLVLTAFLTPLAIWGSFTGISHRAKEYYALMLVLQTGMLGVFCSLDLLLFYVFFEFTLIPLFFLIGIWGGPERARAANKFFIFTVAGSVLTFAAVLYIAWFQYADGSSGKFTFSIPALTAFGASGGMPLDVQKWLFIALAAGFAIKVPLFPVHTWLPLAHTEAPTAGSVILAGVLLKLGSYGFCRLSLPILPEGTLAWAPFMSVLAVCGIIYGALAAWVQDDVKKLVAYSSVSHMGFCMLGLFSLKMAGVTGGVIYMLNHGLSTGALFLVVGMIYERYHTRDIHRIGGLARKMPWMAFFLIVFTLSSIGLPGLNGFLGEMLVLLGTATSSQAHDGYLGGPLGFAYAAPAASGIVLGAVYMLWMCRRVLFGPLNEPPHTPDTSAGLTRDLTRREIGILAPLAVVCLALGVYPKPVIETLQDGIATNILAARAIDGGDAFAESRGNDEFGMMNDELADAGPAVGQSGVVLASEVPTIEPPETPTHSSFSIHHSSLTPPGGHDGP
ncbi:MAG TPA: NADH-quinone oxidoreductase subunit M [Phycisphaerae bacterium]|nr:NADH-quinone oxidoreductase subunit M [Phycisphaerae bacterium]